MARREGQRNETLIASPLPRCEYLLPRTEFEVLGRELYSAPMLPRRFVRITAAVLTIMMGLAVILGYDFHLGTNITETFFEPFIE